MEARLKADVIVVKVSGLMPCARASSYASTGLWRRPHLRSQVSCSSSWYQSYGSWVDLLAFKELVLWFWDCFSGCGGVDNPSFV
ncbi:hypothetical protein IGI04_001681 [Brassica rapa subsp. trilocularis]|uniref:Uncharacterized protein n=1 Tax=Brassica rapa subsp. trilocularis TaxID=1813537 RepID=A0ABQ7NTH6_BRACM|nr:hypothetical protein IGI04_001681 [Brassica rapa subsp. trilocularis]